MKHTLESLVEALGLQHPDINEWLESVLINEEVQQRKVLEEQSQKIQKDLNYCIQNKGKKRLLDNSIKRLTVKPQKHTLETLIKVVELKHQME